jgi:hypothetical protein
MLIITFSQIIAIKTSNMPIYNEKYTITSPEELYTKGIGDIYYRDTSGSSIGVWIEGDYAYIADSTSGLAIIDISDPTHPGAPVYCDTNGYAYDVWVEGDYAFIADYAGGLVIINVTYPTKPVKVSNLVLTGCATSIWIEGDYAYIGAYDKGLAIVDISNVSNPRNPVYRDTNDLPFDVWVEGDFAYVADSTIGLGIINITNPKNPGYPVYRDTTAAVGVWVDGDFAFVADYSAGLAIINITRPTNPGVPIYRDTLDNARDVAIAGDYAFVSCETYGIAIIKFRDIVQPEAPTLEPIVPQIDEDGIIHLNWNDVQLTSTYFIYRNTSCITAINSLTPIKSTPYSNYTDSIEISGNYSYVIVAGNPLKNSSISNCINVTVKISSPNPISGYNLIFCLIGLFLIIIPFMKKIRTYSLPRE